MQGQGGLAADISRDFTAAAFDMSRREGAEPAGWDDLPESVFARSLAAAGERGPVIRSGLTLVAAMDRARDAIRLWDYAVALHAANRWALIPAEVVGHSFTELSDALRTSGVSQRHLPDAAAWRRIAEALVDEPEGPVARVIAEGVGDARDLLAVLSSARAPGGSERFPYLAGPKVGPMWVRMMVFPGGARVSGVEILPVAVDVQVRRTTENLGVTETTGMRLEDARSVIEEAWFTKVRTERTDGPEALAGTCAALDPALWYFGRVGCSQCEAAGERIRFGAACAECQWNATLPAVQAKPMPHDLAPRGDRPLIGLVGCVKTKLPHSAPARELYVSPLFAGRRAAVEGRAERWFVLSSEYGLVEPDQVIAPYDRVLSSLPIDLRRQWSRSVLEALRQKLGNIGRFDFEIHAGQAYFGYGLEAGLRAAGAGVSIPTTGLSQGRQLQYYQGGAPSVPSSPARWVARSASPYQAIATFLEEATGDAVTLSLIQVEKTIGRPLPDSARKYPAWWHGSATHRPPWLESGWRPRPRLRQGLVEFVRLPRAG
jgi:hypothetical protein